MIGGSRFGHYLNSMFSEWPGYSNAQCHLRGVMAYLLGPSSEGSSNLPHPKHAFEIYVFRHPGQAFLLLLCATAV